MPAWSAFGGAFDRGDVDLMHGQHRGHDASRRRLILVGEQIDEPLRRDLPAEAKFVLQPAAGGFLTAIGCELVPVVVGFLLAFRADHEGNGLGKLELRPGIEGDKLNSLELEAGDHHGTGGSGADRKSTRLNSSHMSISYAVFCLKKKNNSDTGTRTARTRTTTDMVTTSLSSG